MMRWWRMRKHDRGDPNCVHWNRDDWGGTCSPCRADGGYVARRHAAIDALRQPPATAPDARPPSDANGRHHRNGHLLELDGWVMC